jgi:glucan phosphoethanolaminetransferase (alkaline phosphatase superfamily)
MGAVFYILFLYILEECIFEFPQAKFFQQTLTFFTRAEVSIALISSVASFLFLFFVLRTALQSSRLFQALYVTLLALSSLIEYGYWKAVQRFLIPEDLKIATATPVATWMGAGELFFEWRFLLPVLVLICFMFMFGKHRPSISSLVRFGYVLVCLVGLTLVQTLLGNPLNPGLSFSSFYQTITRSVMDGMSVGKREMVKYQHSGGPRNNIVLVIDESIRGDHLSINGYGRETTPFLEQLANHEEGFHNLGLAVAGATCSYSSNALLLTGVRPGFDEFELTASYPTLFQYAKAMGYKTYYMDAQTNSFWNGLTARDVSFIDTWLKAFDFGDDLQSDLRAADLIAEIVSEGTGNFIVLNKRGVHFMYEGSYPAESAVWLPLPDDYETHPDLVSNAYDNGVLYNVNTFFERLLADPEVLATTAILYTSDHGQTLFEDNASWLHCNSTLREATVPLILIGRNLPPVTIPPRAQHSNILPTLLDLMAVPDRERIHSYSLSLFSATEVWPTEQYYFDGRLQLNQYSER